MGSNNRISTSRASFLGFLGLATGNKKGTRRNLAPVVLYSTVLYCGPIVSIDHACNARQATAWKHEVPAGWRLDCARRCKKVSGGKVAVVQRHVPGASPRRWEWACEDEMLSKEGRQRPLDTDGGEHCTSRALSAYPHHAQRQTVTVLYSTVTGTSYY